MTKAGISEYKKGLWTEEEDRILVDYIRVHGRRHWNRIPKLTGLMRNGKSCRLRWLNYLSPNVKHGSFSEEEDDLIIRLHNLLGNRWSLIAGRVPGRTDNQVKNHWNTHLRKKLGIRKQTGKVRVPSRSGNKEVEGTENENMSLNCRTLPLSSEQKETEIQEQGSCLNNSVAAINEAQWPGTEEHFDQAFLFADDNFVLDSPAGLMDFFDGFDII